MCKGWLAVGLDHVYYEVDSLKGIFQFLGPIEACVKLEPKVSLSIRIFGASNTLMFLGIYQGPSRNLAQILDVLEKSQSPKAQLRRDSAIRNSSMDDASL